MAHRYTAEELLYLRQSTLCTKPPSLPPAEEWMGPPPEKVKPTNDRPKTGDGLALAQENRRPGLDRNGSRILTNPEEIILGPPRVNFSSATSGRNGKAGDEKVGLREVDRRDRADRFDFRPRTNDADNLNDRSRDGRDGRQNFRRRDDQDGEGWSTVKPRKSFGHEGAERFHGRMGTGGSAAITGAGVDRFNGREDRKGRDDRENGDRRSRGFDNYPRDKEDEESIETPRRNGLTRNRTDPWFRETVENTPSSQRERIDRAKSWRERESDSRPSERQNERHNARWDRDRNERIEREPEWLDEPAGDKAGGHTEEDFKKFMASMKAGNRGAGQAEDKVANTTALDTSAGRGFFEMDLPVASAPAVESSKDNFFAGFGGMEIKTPGADAKEGGKPKAAKASRFMALMTAQEDARAKIEVPSPAPAPAPVSAPGNALLSILAGTASPSVAIPPPQSSEEKEAFAALIQKLQRQTLGGGLPMAMPAPQAPPPAPQQVTAPYMDSRAPPPSQHQPQHQPQPQVKSAVASPEPFQQYGAERREEPRFPQSLQGMISPRPMGSPAQAPPASRPEQVLHDLLAQRHQASSQGSNRMESNAGTSSMNQSQKDFLMGLMQRTEQVPRTADAMVEAHTAQALAAAQEQARRNMLRMGSVGKQGMPMNMQEREPVPRPMRGHAPPGLYADEQFHPEDRPQPTQILQRPPPPPGLDHHLHSYAMVGPGNPPQMPPQRPMIPPPPGLANMANNGLRNAPPMPGAMFPPNFPSGVFPPPPEAMMMGPPRSMQPPPGFFGGAPPPPGFLPPPGPPGFQGGPDEASFGAPHFARRNMMPPGAGNNFPRQ